MHSGVLFPLTLATDGLHPQHASSGSVLCNSQCVLCSDYFSEDELGLCPKCHPRQNCACPNCPRLVYYSAHFGQPFKYCSPVCRDNDLIRSGRAKQSLENLLHKMKQQYHIILVQNARTREWQPQRQTSHSSSADESEDVEMVRFAENRER